MRELQEAETALERALQRFDSSMQALLSMYGSVSVLAVPRRSYAIHAKADRDVRNCSQRLMELRYRARCDERAILRRCGWSNAQISTY